MLFRRCCLRPEWDIVSGNTQHCPAVETLRVLTVASRLEYRGRKRARLPSGQSSEAAQRSISPHPGSFYIAVWSLQRRFPSRTFGVNGGPAFALAGKHSAICRTLQLVRRVLDFERRQVRPANLLVDPAARCRPSTLTLSTATVGPGLRWYSTRVRALEARAVRAGLAARRLAVSLEMHSRCESDERARVGVCAFQSFRAPLR